MPPPYQATFSVPLHSTTCITDISTALSHLTGIHSTNFSLQTQLLTTNSTTPPSAIISTIQSTGRPAILRGSGNAAAVCILETPPSPPRFKVPQASPVRGLARLIELSEGITMVDVTLTGVPRGEYVVSIRQTGDISEGARSMGGVFTGVEANRKGELGRLEVDGEGRGALVGEVDWRVWEMVGRGIMACGIGGGEEAEGEEEGVVMGVVARSAGVWENEKVVCGCSGKTVWEEREEQVARGMF